MKRAGYTVLLAAAALLSLLSCGGNLEPDFPDVPAQEKNTILLRLGGFPLSVETKAHERGINNYNENLIESVDLFFYPDGGTGSNAVFKALGRSVEARTEADSTVYVVSVHYTAAQAVSLFGSTNAGETCQVYAIANANVTYGSSTAVDSLKRTLIERDFSMTEIQNNFVMSSDGTATVTQADDGSGNPIASGRVPVKRAAAKAQVFINLPDSLPDAADPYRFWKPDINKVHFSDGVYVDLVNTSKKGMVDGNYTVVEEDYITSEAHAVAPLSSFPAITPALDSKYDDYSYTSHPFYSYPIAWYDIDERACVFLIHIPWFAVDSGVESPTARSEYRTYQVSANVVDLKFERNHCYRTFVNIKSLGGADADQIVIIPECDYWICPWNSETASAGDGLVTGSFSDYKYLVIDNPEITLNNEEVAKFNYISSSPIASVQIDTIYYYDNNQASPRQMLHRGMTGANLTAFNNAVAQLETPDYTSTPNVVALEHKLSKSLGRYGQWEVVATITNEDGISEMVRFIQNPPIRLERSSKAGDVFVNGFFAWVNQSPGFGDTHRPYLRYHSRRGQSSTSVYHCRSGWSGDTDQSVVYDTGNTRTYGSILGGAYDLAESIDRNFYTTIVNVSSFNTSNSTYRVGSSDVEYRIGDPRVKSSTVYSGSEAWTTVTNFYQYMTGETSSGGRYSPTGTAWDSPGDILISTQSLDDQNIIAPKFLVSSALNANRGLTFETAVKRAATYQEAGYPAGRWRIPTEAEMAFIVARQNDGTIPVLYATGSPYWSGSGRLLTPQSGGSISFSNDDGYTHSVRFVYDLWYWGDEPAATNVYHPNGHNTDY